MNGQPIDLEAIRARLALGEVLLNHEADALLAHIAALQATQLDFSLPPQGYIVHKEAGEYVVYAATDTLTGAFHNYKDALRAAYLCQNTHWAAYQEWAKINANH